MATLSIVAANCLKSTTAVGRVSSGTAGATITAGMAVYLKSADSLIYPADNTTAAKAKVVGIAQHGASAGQPINYQYGGHITIGATIVVGTVYVLSADAGAGGICPMVDLASGAYYTEIGVGDTTAILKLQIAPSGTAIP